MFKRLLATSLALLSATQSNASSLDPKIYSEKQGRTAVHFYADNPNPIPYWVKIDFPIIQGLKPNQKPPFIFDLKPKSKKQHLLSLKASSQRGGYKLETRSSIGMGRHPATVKHNDKHQYLLPFEHGQKYVLGQGYFGGSTHRTPNPYALDFTMDEGSKIYAAREGIVARVKQDSNIGGPSSRYAEHSNVVVIYHNDGTFASYAHLKKNGAKVRVGQQVSAGQLIGLSGNTGQSSGPHLHFEVYRYDENGNARNFPVKFINHDGSTLSKFEQGQYYYARHPNKPNFKATFGRSLTNNDFEFKNSPIKQNDDLTIATETVDDTVLIYVLNGYRRAIEVEIDIELDNFKSSKPLPHRRKILPTSKSFVLMLKPVQADKNGSYKIQYRFWR